MPPWSSLLIHRNSFYYNPILVLYTHVPCDSIPLKYSVVKCYSSILPLMDLSVIVSNTNMCLASSSSASPPPAPLLSLPGSPLQVDIQLHDVTSHRPRTSYTANSQGLSLSVSLLAVGRLQCCQRETLSVDIEIFLPHQVTNGKSNCFNYVIPHNLLRELSIYIFQQSSQEQKEKNNRTLVFISTYHEINK